MKYIVLNGDMVVGCGFAPDGMEPPGSIVVDAFPSSDHSLITLWDGHGYVYTGEPKIKPVDTALSRRVLSYPPVGDQLDAIWKAIAPLIEHPEAEAVLARIQAVKDANPKP